MTTPIKIVIAGEGRCGKTTWIHRILTGEFKRTYAPTAGCNFEGDILMSVGPTKEDALTYSVQLHDTAGQTRFMGPVPSGDFDGVVIFVPWHGKHTSAEVVADYASAYSRPFVVVPSMCDVGIIRAKDYDTFVTRLNAEMKRRTDMGSPELPYVITPHISSRLNINLYTPLESVLKLIKCPTPTAFVNVE